MKDSLGGSSALRTMLASVLERIVAPVPAQQISDHASAGTWVDTIDDYIERHLDRLNVPGAAIAIVEGDRIVHLRGFGRARPGGERSGRSGRGCNGLEWASTSSRRPAWTWPTRRKP